MAWTSMHFAVGMGCAGAAFGLGCLLMKRGWRWLPGAMTLGGLWGIVPDLPRLWREDFAWLPFASTLGAKTLEADLHAIGNLFFFHQALDAQPHEYALHGLVIMLALYNAAILMLLWMERKQRKAVRSLQHDLTPSLRFEGHMVRSSHLQRSA